MELVIYSPTSDGFVKEIQWNHEEIKKEVAEKVKYYVDLVYTDEQIQEAKADRAKLRKFVEALESKRKEIKKQCLAPYEAFEKELKEITAIVNEPILMIDGQVKNYEEGKREEKLEEVLKIYNGLTFPDWATPDKILSEKYLNVSVKLPAIEKELTAKREQIEKDLSTLQNLPVFAFEAIEVYKDILDLNKAIEEGKRLSEIQKRKAEAEAAQKAVEKVDEVVINNAPDVSAQIPEKITPKNWVAFEAHLSTEDALALKEFFKSRGIEFRRIAY